MSKPWTAKEKTAYYQELKRLYTVEGKTISQIGNLLGVSQQTVFSRLKRFHIPANPKFKKRQDVIIPKNYNSDIAEFFGIMLGDGKLSHFQIAVNLGTKENEYANKVVRLIKKIFNCKPKIAIRKTGHKDVYLGSVDITNWLKREGLVYNKVLAQVDVPKWIFTKKEFMKGFIKGFFDTDGSIYKLRWGAQLSFSNKSMPMLKSIQILLNYLNYSPSKISNYKVYLTKKSELLRFFKEIKPGNLKHQRRFKEFCKLKNA